MIKIDKNFVKQYLQNDYIMQMLENNSCSKFVCDEWLQHQPTKRAIYSKLYGDLLDKNGIPKKVLDIGGGLSSIAIKLLARKHYYELLDILTYDTSMLKKISGCINLIQSDWYKFSTFNKKYDIIIANDLFPNVDQRLELFIKKFLYSTKELRLSLTYYNNDNFYKTKRVDAEEVLYYLAWNQNQLKSVLEKFLPYIVDVNFELFNDKEVAPNYSNGRQIVLVTLRYIEK